MFRLEFATCFLTVEWIPAVMGETRNPPSIPWPNNRARIRLSTEAGGNILVGVSIRLATNGEFGTNIGRPGVMLFTGVPATERSSGRPSAMLWMSGGNACESADTGVDGLSSKTFWRTGD